MKKYLNINEHKLSRMKENKNVQTKMIHKVQNIIKCVM